MSVGSIRTGRQLRILIADDNRDGADTLAVLVRLSGHDTRTAHDGELARRIATSGWPDIAVLDLEMPMMSGYEVAKAVRQTALARHMTLVALTGWTRDAERARARDAGFDAFLTKPVEFADFEILLRDLDPAAPP